MEFQHTISIITQFWPTSALPYMGGNTIEGRGLLNDANSLATEPAAWWFPVMKKYAGNYYQDWIGV